MGEKILMRFSRLILEVKSQRTVSNHDFLRSKKQGCFPDFLTRIKKMLAEVLAWYQLPVSLENCVCNSFGK
jgi:hypothetical protein